jgi:hypothetical protein
MTSRVNSDELKEFGETLKRLPMEFRGDVLRIRHSFSYDWDGEPAIFFRIVLSDAASRSDRLADITGLVGGRVFDELGLAQSEYTPYFYFRSEAETNELKDPEWE